MSWNIDQAHSHISFSVRHMMIATVRGEFTEFKGTVAFDEQNPAATTVDVEIDVNSLNTRDPQRDGHLKSPDFLDAENYPAMRFQSTRVEVLDDSHGRLVGDLTIRGENREVTLDVTYNGMAKSPWGTTSAGFSATGKIDRKDWDLTWNQVLETGGVLVGDEIIINLELEIVKQEEAAPAAT